jgi:exodeoxyribonuclease V
VSDRVTLSAEQEAAVRRIDEWLGDGTLREQMPVFRLFGPAGSGKTTLARTVVDRHDGALLAAFAGKAAHVLGQKVGREARTLHSSIYWPDTCIGSAGRGRPCTHGEYEPHVVFILNHRDGALASANYLILDECSMVGTTLGNDVLSFGKPILALGDPYQLPPPEGHGYFTNRDPHVLLTEVYRHRDDGGIIGLATAIRLGESIGGHPSIIAADTALDEFEPDMIVCGTNATRVHLNQTMRGRMGYSPADLPQPGEKLICMQNSPEHGLLNGQLLDVVEVRPVSERKYTAILYDPINSRRYTVPAYLSDLTRQSPLGSNEYTPSVARLTYAYAITCHKAQGSEWDRVLVVDEWSWGEEARWLYTAVTRASKGVRIVRNKPC